MAVELKITMDDAGNVGVNGPIENLILCYGLLEIGRQSIHRHHEQNAGKLIQTPPSGMFLPRKD